MRKVQVYLSYNADICASMCVCQWVMAKKKDLSVFVGLLFFVLFFLFFFTWPGGTPSSVEFPECYKMTKYRISGQTVVTLIWRIKTFLILWIVEPAKLDSCFSHHQLYFGCSLVSSIKNVHICERWKKKYRVQMGSEKLCFELFLFCIYVLFIFLYSSNIYIYIYIYISKLFHENIWLLIFSMNIVRY